MALAESILSTNSAQTTNTILMVSPDSFGFNDQTASTNTFQNKVDSLDQAGETRNKALNEFNEMVTLLRTKGIEVVVSPSRKDVVTPDAIFPNNWISFHKDGPFKAILYPMLAPNRRAERQLEEFAKRLPWIQFKPDDVLDLTHYERDGQFLEGTGSLIFDRVEKVVFAHESPRTSYQVLDDFCEQTGYEPVKFHAYDKGGTAIYHTNVVMGIGRNFSVVCLESIQDIKERDIVSSTLKDLGKDIVDISLDQLHSFCGNIMEVQPLQDRSKIVMSITAFHAFTKGQKEQLLSHGDLVPVHIPTIETIGGGSARCMMAEVFLR